MTKTMNNATELINIAEQQSRELFNAIDDIALYNQRKVLDAFKNNRISARHLCQTSGYGYDDVGRDTLCRLFADIFKTDSAIVSPNIASGTHALTIALFGILRPGDLMLSVTGKPYDTLDDVIKGENIGSLADFGVKYDEIELKNDSLDFVAIEEYLSKIQPKMLFLQRSQGYLWREPLDITSISTLKELRDKYCPSACIMVDNCYGEFTGKSEPTEYGADIVAGSLIKNMGGGLAPTGGYIAGKSDFITQIGYRLTSSSVGTEVGSYAYGYTSFYEGLFLAPSTVANALKGSVLSGNVFKILGIETNPAPEKLPRDIIRAIKFNDRDKLIKFCEQIQANSPIDSYVVPEPWGMPGYNEEVIMSAGTFVQGASLELTSDAPIKPPYIGYLQGGLTYEHVKIAMTEVVETLFFKNYK